jgi:hypothetical protein
MGQYKQEREGDWTLVQVIDIYEHERSGLNPEKVDMCENCGKEKLRWIHIIRDRITNTTIKVGGSCASKMIVDAKDLLENLKQK